MKKFIAVLISIFISLSMYSLAYAERECVGTTVVKAEVYLDSSTPANVFELENGAVLIQSDELAKYGTYDWSSETHTISIDFENSAIMPQRQPFHNALGIDEKGLRNKYVSVSFPDCGYNEVNFLAAAGIVQGMDDGSFAPDKSITREEAAAILYRMAEFLGNKTIIQHRDAVYYNDENEISDWAVNAVKSMYEMGIMKGINDYDFSPKGTYTVEQAIATMLRLYECG